MARIPGGLNLSGLRGIVFDMDGVIINSHPAHRLAWKGFLTSVGRETRDEELDFILEGGKRAEILKHFLGELAPEQIVEMETARTNCCKSTATQSSPYPASLNSSVICRREASPRR